MGTIGSIFLQFFFYIYKKLIPCDSESFKKNPATFIRKKYRIEQNRVVIY